MGTVTGIVEPSQVVYYLLGLATESVKIKGGFNFSTVIYLWGERLVI